MTLESSTTTTSIGDHGRSTDIELTWREFFAEVQPLAYRWTRTTDLPQPIANDLLEEVYSRLLPELRREWY